MQSNSSYSYPRRPVPVSPGSEPSSRVTSQGYSLVSPIEHYDHINEPAVTTMNTNQVHRMSEEHDHELDNGYGPASVEPNATSERHSEGQLGVKQYEVGVRSVHSDDEDDSAKRQSWYGKTQNTVRKFWLWEALACVFSLMCLGSIIGVLTAENNKRLDDWGWAIPPGAVVSFIATLAKASLVLVLAQVLSQLKWLHFQDTKSLNHLRIFDWSSRGPLGSLLVIWNSKRFFASLAALLMLLTILVDPFVQLVFSFPSWPDVDLAHPATFLRTNSWPGETVTLPTLPSQKLWTSLNVGLAGTGTNTTLICPSGNCEWTEPVKTLGICGSCSDVTSDVHTDCTNFDSNISNEDGLQTVCSYTFPGSTSPDLQASLWLQIGDDHNSHPYRTIWNSTGQEGGFTVVNASTVNITLQTILELAGEQVDLGLFTPGVLSVTDGSIIDFKAIHLPQVNPSNLSGIPQANCWHCGLKWCEKTYENISVTNGGSPIFTISERPLWLVSPYADSGTADSGNPNGSVNYADYPSTFDNLKGKVWNFNYYIDDTLSAILAPLFTSYYVENDGYDLVNPPAVSAGQAMDLTTNPGAMFGFAYSDDLNVTMHNLAASLTELVRTEKPATNTNGTTNIETAFIQVRWGWLALPLALLVITSILLPIIAVQSHKRKVAVWKDDPLALLFHRVEGMDVLPGSNVKTGTSDLNNLADEVYVKLDQDTLFKFIRSVKPGRMKQERKWV